MNCEKVKKILCIKGRMSRKKTQKSFGTNGSSNLHEENDNPKSIKHGLDLNHTMTQSKQLNLYGKQQPNMYKAWS